MNLNKFTEKVCSKLFWVATLAIVFVFLLIVIDVILRVLRMPIAWGYEVVILVGAIAVGASLPQTTFKKSHVIMEFGIGDRFKSWQRIFVFINRCCGIIILAIFGWRSFLYGKSLWTSHQVTPILHLPDAIGPYFLGFCCIIVCIVLIADLHLSSKRGS